MAEMSPVVVNEIQGLMSSNNIIQNILGIKVIEIEQLNPRIREINGIMKVKYHSLGGDINDPDGSIDYEYDWVGGTVEFIPNPYPRPPLGTGKVAFIADDENDPQGKGVPLPQSSKSGNDFGWNREFLASHYAEGYWRIVDSAIDQEIRDRYRSILTNMGIKPEEADKMVSNAVQKQLSGMSGGQKVTISRSSGPVVRETIVKQAPQASEIENHPLFDAIRKENAELKEMIKKLADGNREEKRPRGTKCAATGKDGNPCKGFAKEGSDFCVIHEKIMKKAEVAEPTGNLG